MEKVRTVNLIGSGNSYNYHEKTINILSSLFQISPKEFDCQVISNKLEDRFETILGSTSSIVIEKPIIHPRYSPDEVRRVFEGKDFFPCFHPLYSPMYRYLSNMNFAGLKKASFIRRQNLVIETINKDEYKFTGFDNLYNSLSTIVSIFDNVELEGLETTNDDFFEANSKVNLKSGEVVIEIITDWESSENIKKTVLTFEDNDVVLDYSLMQVISNNDEVIEDFSSDSDRVLDEYLEMYREIYGWLTKDNDAEYLRDIFFATHNILHQIVEN